MKQKLRIFLSITFLITSFTYFAHAQGVRYTGKVISKADLSTLPGLSIAIKGTSRGTLTNEEGFFEITANPGETLVVTGVGVSRTETILGSKQSLEISVGFSSKALNEVVVTALGIKKEVKKLSYSVQEVKGVDLIRAREANPISSLVGKVAGLNIGVNQELLGTPIVLLRGNNVTLYVVDGIPINTDTYNINADDIDTYTVLKGPVAAALYGSRGKYGAILITTKRGKKSDKNFTIEVNSTFQINSGFIAIPKVQNEYGGGDNSQYAFGDGTGGGKNDADYDVWGPRLDGRLLPQYDGVFDPNNTYTTTFKDGLGHITLDEKGNPSNSTYTGHIIPTPWIARGVNNLDHFLQTGILNTNNINFSQASDHSNIRFSATNTNLRGVTPNTGINSINFNVAGGFDVTNRLKVDGSINFNRQFTPNVPDVSYGPNSIIYGVDIWTGADWNIDQVRNYWQPNKVGIQSLYVEYKRYQNPWFQSYEWLRGHYKNDLQANSSINFKIDKIFDLLLQSNISTYNLFRSEKEPFSAHPYGDEHNHGNYREDHRDLFENNTDLILKFHGNQEKSLLNFSGLIGSSIRSFHYNSSFISTNQLISPNYYNFQNSLFPIRAANYLANMQVLSGYYSADISLKDFVTISTTGRVEKSSAVQNRTYFYPSFGFATVLSDYLSLPSSITLLKVRGSWANIKDGGTQAYIGTTPNANYGDIVGYGGDYSSNYGGPNFFKGNPLQPSYSSSNPYNNQVGASKSNIVVDPSLKVSSRVNSELGLDVKFVNGRLGFSGTYFQNIDGPSIFVKKLSEASGTPNFTTNANKLRQRGVEFSLQGNPIMKQKGLNWEILANFSTYRETYDEVGNPDRFNYKGGRTDILTGALTLKSPDGQIIHDGDGYPIYTNKDQAIGYGDPDFAWGINNKLSYKGFKLSFQFDGMVGGQIQDYVKRKLFEGGRGIETVSGEIGRARRYESDNFTATGYSGAVNSDGSPILGQGVQVANGGSIDFNPETGQANNLNQLTYIKNKTATLWVQNYVYSLYRGVEHTVVSKTFSKLREVILGYSIPKNLLKGSPVRKLEFSLVGRNLLYFFNKGFKDIDVDQFPGRGTDNANHLENDLQTPTTRSYGFNINITF